MLKNVIAIRREDLSKTGEKRAALTPEFTKVLVQNGHQVLVQPKLHPVTGTDKRAFEDSEYIAAGAAIEEDITSANVIIGLKEIGTDYIYPERTYLCFSHTHKGQLKNRHMLSVFAQRKTTLIDYELVTDVRGVRTITAFTYFAGYAGMIESMWALGLRYSNQGIPHPFSQIPQSIELEDLDKFKAIIQKVGAEISEKGTPDSLPPLIIAFLGNGKTSQGAQAILDILPTETITKDQIAGVFANGNRHKVYKLVLSIPDMYRLQAYAAFSAESYQALSREQKERLYIEQPELFEGDIEAVLPFASMIMNCVLWSPKYPRLITNEGMRSAWHAGSELKVIGDISCDPEGAIQFSRETWVDEPVYIWHPDKGDLGNGMTAEGIAVMAVTNLPCAFSADASQQFARDWAHLMPAIASANYDGSIDESGLPDEVKKAVILWNGDFTAPFTYMKAYLEQPVVM